MISYIIARGRAGLVYIVSSVLVFLIVALPRVRGKLRWFVRLQWAASQLTFGLGLAEKHDLRACTSDLGLNPTQSNGCINCYCIHRTRFHHTLAYYLAGVFI